MEKLIVQNIDTYPSIVPQSHGNSSKRCDNTAIEATSKNDGIKVNLITIPKSFFSASKSKPRPAKSIMLTSASSLQCINFYLKRIFRSNIFARTKASHKRTKKKSIKQKYRERKKKTFK